MSEIHVTRALLEAVVRGELPARALAELAQKHLLCASARNLLFGPANEDDLPLFRSPAAA